MGQDPAARAVGAVVTSQAVVPGGAGSAGGAGVADGAKAARVRADRATAVAWLTVCAAGVASAVLTALVWDRLAGGDAVSNLGGPVAAVLYATLGVLIVRKAGNLTGWFLLAEGAGLVVVSLASAWAVFGLDHPGTLPAPAAAGLLAECSFVPTGMGLAAILLVFPTGALPSRRWRPAAAAMAAATALMLAAFVVRPRQLQLPAPRSPSVPDP